MIFSFFGLGNILNSFYGYRRHDTECVQEQTAVGK